MEKKTSHDSETPAHGKQVMSACAFIHSNFDGINKLFLAKRADTKKFLPGMFELPGGHVDFGEELIDGLQREIKEEFGMSVSIGDPFAAYTYQNHVKGSHTVQVNYFARFVESLDKIQINPEDHSSYEWFSLEDVKNRTSEIIPEEYKNHRLGNDPEYLTILKGFELLNGEKLNLG
jgi:8-oxo-dGTP diphosphatase